MTYLTIHKIILFSNTDIILQLNYANDCFFFFFNFDNDKHYSLKCFCFCLFLFLMLLSLLLQYEYKVFVVDHFKTQISWNTYF